jgi:AcrR family transcriptional regulator
VESTRAAEPFPAAARRVAWSGRSSPQAGTETARDKIIDAAIACISRRGLERTSISAIAAIAGVSRPTVYAYFDSREAVVSAALEKAAASVVARVIATARRRARTAGDFAVEALVVARREFRAEPALYPIGRPNPNDPWAAEQALSDEALAFARPFLAPIASYDPSLADDLDEITETLVRWLLSLLMFDSARTSSEAKLRAYLRRRVVPALGLATSEP